MARLRRWIGNGREKPKQGHVDYVVLGTTIALIAFGLLMLFSASFYYGQNRFGDGYYYIKKQLLGIAIGAVLMFVLSRIDYHIWLRLAVPIYFAGIVILLLVWVPGIGISGNEATRWVKLPGGIQFQPSELTKYALIIAVAAMVEKFGPERMNHFIKGVVPTLIIMAPIGLLLLLQPNFSMLAIIAIACFIMLIMAGVQKLQLGILAGVGLGVGSAVMLAKGYRAGRVSSFLDPWNSGESGYQLRQSLIAFGSGGFWGKGLGASRQKFLFLPYGESDMIFAIIAEELGFVGATILMLVYAFLYARCFRIAMRCPDTGGSLLAGGITTLLTIQTLVNVGVATGTLPTTGQTLPFISAGTTSVIVCMAVIGLILNISRSCN